MKPKKVLITTVFSNSRAIINNYLLTESLNYNQKHLKH